MGLFPYQDAAGVLVFVDEKPDAELCTNGWPCKVCKSLISPSKMREHVGCHFLAKHVPPSACGCCGGMGCTAQLTTNSQPEISCSSGYFQKDGVKAWNQASTIKDGSKCTNTPLQCLQPACKKHTIWKYGMAAHWAEKHLGEPIPAHGMPGAWCLGPNEIAHMKKHSRSLKKLPVVQWPEQS